MLSHLWEFASSPPFIYDLYSCINVIHIGYRHTSILSELNSAYQNSKGVNEMSQAELDYAQACLVIFLSRFCKSDY